MYLGINWICKTPTFQTRKRCWEKLKETQRNGQLNHAKGWEDSLLIKCQLPSSHTVNSMQPKQNPSRLFCSPGRRQADYEIYMEMQNILKYPKLSWTKNKTGGLLLLDFKI